MSTDCINSQDIAFSEAIGLSGHAQPEEIFVLTSSQLEALISRAVARAQAPLLERIERLESRLNVLPEEGVGCRGGEEPWPQAVQEHAHKESTRAPTSQPGAQGSYLLQSRIIYLEDENRGLKAQLENLEELRPWLEAPSKKLARLEAPTPSRKTEARAEKIKRYLKERPDHKATYETLRGHLGIDKRRLLEAIKLLIARDPSRYGISRLPGDKRGRALIMLPK